MPVALGQYKEFEEMAVFSSQYHPRSWLGKQLKKHLTPKDLVTPKPHVVVVQDNYHELKAG